METEKKKDVVKDAKDKKADGAPAKKQTKKDEKKEEELVSFASSSAMSEFFCIQI